MISPEDFATETLGQLETARTRFLSAYRSIPRRLGEALFERMNSR